MAKKVKKKIYKAKTASFYHGKLTDKDAQTIGEFLEKHFPDGKFGARDVVDLARSKSSPLHRFFEWDDKKAAEEYRYDTARHLIRCITVEIEDYQTPAYTNIKIDGANTYIDTIEALETPILFEQILDKAIQEAEIWSNRYKMYEELNEIREIIHKTKEKINGKRENVGKDKKTTAASERTV